MESVELKFRHKIEESDEELSSGGTPEAGGRRSVRIYHTPLGFSVSVLFVSPLIFCV